MKGTKSLAYLQIHTAVFLFGFTAILGKLIVFEQLALVWHRLWISVLGLLFIPGVVKGLKSFSRKSILRFTGIGVLVSIHWVTFYGCIKIADSSSIALACLATSTLFVSFLEPLITKSKFQSVEVILGVLVIIGLLMVLNVGSAYYTAILVGLISAFFAALFSVLNKKYLADHNTLSVSIIELFSGWIFLSLIIPIYEGGKNLKQYSLFRNDLVSEHAVFGLHLHSLIYLLILGLLCTSLAYALSLTSLKVLSAFTTNLAINIEPVYGILMAAIIFHENKDLNIWFYLGTGIILLSVLIHPYLVRITDKLVKARILRES
ncbi:MAG: EamA family transporter [Bacteroidetes bacterium]|nr:EamA family transporter [Bacteroidota bacterium]